MLAKACLPGASQFSVGICGWDGSAQRAHGVDHVDESAQGDYVEDDTDQVFGPVDGPVDAQGWADACEPGQDDGLGLLPARGRTFVLWCQRPLAANSGCSGRRGNGHAAGAACSFTEVSP